MMVWMTIAIMARNRMFKLKQPISIKLALHKDTLIAEYMPLNIFAYGQNMGELARDFGNEFSLLWDAIVCAEDKHLTDGAKELKRRMTGIVEAVVNKRDEKEVNMFKFELGDVLEDGDTGFEGVAVARAESLKDPFGLDRAVISYLLYSIPVLPLSTSFEVAGKMDIEYGWYREEGLTFVRKGIKAK